MYVPTHLCLLANERDRKQHFLSKRKKKAVKILAGCSPAHWLTHNHIVFNPGEQETLCLSVCHSGILWLSLVYLRADVFPRQQPLCSPFLLFIIFLFPLSMQVVANGKGQTLLCFLLTTSSFRFTLNLRWESFVILSTPVGVAVYREWALQVPAMDALS